jgi:hypothetical protein
VNDTHSTAVTATPAPESPLAGPDAPAVVGFLSIVTDATGVFGGYLVTNAWGRPLEFRLSTAVAPNRVQQILYGPTLTEYLHAELIGKTLIEKTAAQPTLVVTDSVAALGIRGRLGIPVVCVNADEADDLLTLPAGKSGTTLSYYAKFAGDGPALAARLEAVDPAVDLAEPFARVREAMAEARKMGVTNRAA